jgi:hypothetical protein
MVLSFLFAAALTVFGSSCADTTSTQLVVLMDTDYDVPAEVDRIRARVSKVLETEAGAEEVETWSRVFSVDGDPTDAGQYALPATFAILPAAGDLDREIVIELEALANGSNQVLVARRVRTGFVPAEARLIRILIYRACADLSCPDGQSCGCAGGAACATPSCVDEWLPPQELETIDDPAVLPPNSEFPDGTGADGGVSTDGSISSDDGGSEPDGSVDLDGGTECVPPLTPCDFECVNTDIDPRYCGDCSTVCPGGYVCEGGSCSDPGDCRTNELGCTGFTYCDEATGNCLRGCINDEQCIKDHELCDVDTHECVCSSEFERCAFDCVDTQNDPRFCGDCLISCPSGEVCEAGGCLDLGDCRTNGVGCAGFTYCDETTGDCLRGCEDNAQCTGDDQVCDTTAHECVCAPGFHSCGGACVSNLDVNTCGTSCTPCPVPPSATPTCDAGVCDFICSDNFEPCGDACCPISCPSGQVLFNQACASVHIQTADDQGNLGEYTSIALDAAEVPHIAYYAASGKNLFYSTRQTTVPWSRETADAPGNVGEYASLAFGPQGNPTVAYYESGDRDLKLATRQSNGSWTALIVDSEGDVGTYASLAFGPSGLAHVSYYDQTNKDLMLATRQSNGTWSVQTVDGQGDVGQYTSLAFDPEGLPHISYYDQTNKDLMLATRQSNGTWTVQTVADQGNVGQYSSLAFDPDGLARISYYDESNGDLALADEQTDGTWVLQAIDGQDDVGKHSSIAIDAAGLTHISYYDATNRDLKHAARRPGQGWKIQTVDSQGDVGRFCSIAVDAEGHAHISYYDATNTDLKYALVAAPE